MKIQPGFKFGKRVLEAIKARNGQAASRTMFAHVCGVEAQLANIRHKSNFIINKSLPKYCSANGSLQKKEGHESRPDITI